MKRHLWILLAGIVLACPGSSTGLADDPKIEEGYVSLFNGKDLTGWRLGGTKLDGKTDGWNEIRKALPADVGLVALPMSPGVSSMNLATAVAATLYALKLTAP